MRIIDTPFNLRGRSGETIFMTVNGTWPLPGVQASAGAGVGADGTFTLSPPREAAGVKIDFGEAEGDVFVIRLSGSEPSGDVSVCTVRRRTNPFRVVNYKFDVVALILLLGAATAAAQPAPADEPVRRLFDDYIEEVLAEPPARRAARTDPQSDTLPFVLSLIAGPARDMVVAAFETQRIAKQIGAPAPASGSTSVAVRGDSPSILGLAFEHGLITGARTGESVTFRGNLVGLLEAGTRLGFVESYDDDGPAARWLRKMSFSVSFDPGAADDAVVDPDADRLTGWSARLDLRNERDPRHPAHRAAWAQLAVADGQALLDATTEAVLVLWDLPEFRRWRDETRRRVAAVAADDAAVRKVLDEQIAAFAALPLTPSTRRAVNRVAVATFAYLEGRAGLLGAASRAPLLVFEYASDRPADQPRTSDLRVIAEVPFLGGHLVANGSAALFDSVPPGADRVRHIDAAVQWDIPLQRAEVDEAVVLTVACRVQHLTSGIVLAGALVPDTEGTIGVFQLKATVPIRAAALRIPVSVTWANRSELVKERFVRGQVGVTFDFDTLVARGLAVRNGPALARRGPV